MTVPHRLETKRLVIRRFVIGDLESLYSFFSDEEATRFLTFTDEQKTFEGAKKLLRLTVKSYDSANPIFSLAVTKKHDNTYMGAVGLSPINGSRDFEVFYTLLPRFWGRGFATEAAESLLKYAFKELDLARIFSYISPENNASENVARRLGMDYLGIVERHDTKTKVRLYSIGKSQFLSYFE